MTLGISIILFAFFVISSEKANESTINPYAVTILFTIGYLFVSLIFFQYFDFKKKIRGQYIIEFLVVFISMHIYGSRLKFDSITSVSFILMTVNILFSFFFIKQISSDCRRIPNIKNFSIGVFGEYPIKTTKASEKVKTLIWVIALIPFLSYLLWL